MKRYHFLIFLLAIALLNGCRAYKQDIMFGLDENFTSQELSSVVRQVERNYVIQVNDLLSLDVFTNAGERIVDPNNELLKNNQGVRNRPEFSYLVKTDGTVKFPIVGQVKVDSLTLDQAELILQKKYDVFYKESFVKLHFSNKRVVVLGAANNGGQIIPLTNENMSLVEVLAVAGGLEIGSRSQDIRVIRGNLANPEVYQVDLSTIAGMKASMMDIQPGDIIYIEPLRRPFIEGSRDIAPILSLVTSTLALILVLRNQ